MRISDWSSDVCSSDLQPASRPASVQGRSCHKGRPSCCTGYFQFRRSGRVDNLSGMATGLAGRYATALFGLAREGKQIDTVSASLAKVRDALAESEDFRALTASPLNGRGAATAAVLGPAEAMGGAEGRRVGKEGLRTGRSGWSPE